ncbi:MAG TPA: hypothetical protein VLJ59_10105 [Mycobacteriales bacterium]|nr:hypothetical protein [Mycobacteriales bacterium]
MKDDFGPTMAQIDLARLYDSLRHALGLLRRTYSSSPDGGGGWYHQLESPNPGATATALGLMILRDCHEDYEHLHDALTFLRVRQVESNDPRLDGGWATNTSFGRPVTEATGWVARMIGTLRTDLVAGGPDARRAERWLAENQNNDGGWGSLKGCPSRVWLTCLALRGLVQLNPYHPVIDHGLDWLMRSRRETYAWGEVPGAPPTVTHTAFVLLTVTEVRPKLHDDWVLRAYDWLSKHLDVASLDDRAARMETYSVAYTDHGAKTSTAAGRLALWHYGLPVGICALLRDPRSPHTDLVYQAVNTVLDGQLDGGQWPTLSGSPGISSLWGVWWCTQALLDLRRAPLVRPGDLLVGCPGAIVVKSAEMRSQPLSALVGRPPQIIRLRRLLVRHWATLLLGSFVVVAIVGVATNKLSWQDFAVGMIFPLGLFGVQEYRGRRSGRQPEEVSPSSSNSHQR